MAIFSASFFFVYFRVAFRLFYLNCIKHFGFRRFLMTTGFLWFLGIASGIVMWGRLMDEIFFRKYRKMKVEKPIFIISNPRSGTTYLHHLMSLDEERYSFTKLYHTIFPSVTLIKIVDFITKIDDKTFGWMRKFIEWIDGKVFGAWDGIHKTGFFHPEEDEATYVYTMVTSASFMLCPYLEDLQDLVIPDDLPEKVRNGLMAFFKSSLQRINYAQGTEKIFLSKNVLSTGRIRSLLKTFPDARFIYLFRNPYESVASTMSMFTVPWNFHSPDISSDSPQAREWGKMGMRFYEYFDDFMEECLDDEQVIVIPYEEMVADPHKKVLEVYDHFKMEPSPEYLERLAEATNRARGYKSKHTYSLEEFGMSKAEVRDRLKDVMLKYGVEL